MTTTGHNVEHVLLSQYRGKKQRDGKIRSNSPFRPESDSLGFVCQIAPEGEHGWYKDFVSGDSGSLYQLAEFFKIPVPRKEATVTKRGYANLKEYAEAHGVPEKAYADAGWKVGERRGRKALLYPTLTGEIARFMDGQEPRYDSPVEYKACWYGLQRAVTFAKAHQTALFLCNGAPSVVAAQHWEVAAACKTGSESALTPDMLAALDIAWQGDIVLCPDNDNTGQNWRKALQGQLGARVHIVEMGLTSGGDLADFCMLHKENSRRELTRRAFRIPDQDEPEPALTFIATDQILTSVISSLYEPDGLMSIENPFNILHQYGGIAHIIAQNEIMGIVAPSGGGKTIWIETGLLNLMRRGVHSIVISNEWMDKNGLKFGYRLIQRMGGPTYEQMQSHQLALRAEATGRPPNGYRKLNADEIHFTQNVVKQLREMPGRNYYGTAPGLSAERVVTGIHKYHKIACREGNRPSAVWIDYGQQLWLEHQERSSRMQLDVAMEIIREVCNELELVIFVGSQMKKDDAELVRSGGKFEISSMQWMSEQPFQLLLFAVPWVEHDTPQTNGQGQELLRAQILKNSTGGQSPVFTVPWNPARLWIYDAKESTALYHSPKQRELLIDVPEKPTRYKDQYEA